MVSKSLDIESLKPGRLYLMRIQGVADYSIVKFIRGRHFKDEDGRRIFMPTSADFQVQKITSRTHKARVAKAEKITGGEVA